MESSHKFIIGLLIILIFLILYKKQENAGSTDMSSGSLAYSTEAVQNISKVYADTSGTATFNNVQITGNLNVIPKGLVSMWTGTIAPNGWALCDGKTYIAKDGTSLVAPDLRGRFVLGYNIDASGVDGLAVEGEIATINTGARVGSSFSNSIGMTGGEVIHNLTIGEIPTHTHGNLGYTNYGSGDYTGGARGGDFGTWTANPVFNTGGSKSHNTIPPYYVLAYIIKL